MSLQPLEKADKNWHSFRTSKGYEAQIRPKKRIGIKMESQF